MSFTGWVPDPGPYIAGATVLAIPSRDEAFSQTAIIGLAHGVPVIGTEVDGFPATLGDGRGILVAPEDPQALAAALQAVLDGDAGPPAALAKPGRAVRPRPRRGDLRAHLPRPSRPRRGGGADRLVSPGRIVAHPVLSAEAPLSWSEGAMTPAGLEAVCAEVTGRHRRRIVECGSGFSTLVLARLLHTHGGRLVSLEHDPTWATRVQSNLAAAGLAEIAQVALAPLEPHPLARDGLQWYAQRALRSLPPNIDLLLVDGPPGVRARARAQPLSRATSARRAPRPRRHRGAR